MTIARRLLILLAVPLLILLGLSVFLLFPEIAVSLDPVEHPKYWEMAAEFCVIIGLFGTGLRIDRLVKRYLSTPVTHSVDPAVAPVSTMTHHVFHVQTADKAEVVRQLASGLGRSVLFTRTKH